MTIVGAEGVTTYYGVTASCTESITANNPYKSSGKAWASVQFQRSLGCVGNRTITALLDSEGPFGLFYERARNTSTSQPGTNKIISATYTCQSSNSTKWRAGGVYDNGGVTWSANTTLSCGYLKRHHD